MAEYIYEVYDGGGAWSGQVLRGEIIRCCDCKTFETADCAVYRALRADGRIDEHGMFNPNGFCAWAERDA